IARTRSPTRNAGSTIPLACHLERRLHGAVLDGMAEQVGTSVGERCLASPGHLILQGVDLLLEVLQLAPRILHIPGLLRSQAVDLVGIVIYTPMLIGRNRGRFLDQVRNLL